MHRPGSRRHLVALVLAAASWGLGTVLSKQAVSEISPFVLLPAQLAVSVLFLVVAARIAGRQVRPTWGLLGRLGLLNPGLAYALSLIGLTQITASLSVLIWAGEPVLILLLATAVLGERPTGLLLALSAVAIGGIGLVSYDPAASGGLAGVVLTVVGIGACALYTVITRRWLPGAPSTLDVILAQQVYALGFATVVALLAILTGVATVPTGLTPGAAVSVVASGLLYYGVAYWLYLTGLRVVPASIAAVSFYLIPVFGVLGATVLGERLTTLQWLGGLVVVAAVAVVTTRTAEAQPSRASASAQMAMTPSSSIRR
jgi:drug/metabolite transporter (DMT)-like permease